MWPNVEFQASNRTRSELDILTNADLAKIEAVYLCWRAYIASLEKITSWPSKYIMYARILILLGLLAIQTSAGQEIRLLKYSLEKLTSMLSALAQTQTACDSSGRLCFQEFQV